MVAATPVSWVPENLPAPPPKGTGLGGFLKPAQGQAVLDAASARFPDRKSWDAYVQHARQRIQEGMGLAPWPKRSPLNLVIRQRRTYDGYSVENVAFESVPGYLVTGNLYRPLNARPPFAAMLSTHGHARAIARTEDYDTHARFSPTMQARCATLARMGAVVLSIDMFAYGESMAVFGQAAHRDPLALTIQTWNAIRAVDFLLSLEGVDSQRIGVSGESGGGTQSFLLAALDPRIALSAPVVMVSSYFFGGCPCESGQPIHRSSDHFVSNAMIAAFAAPRPQLIVSDVHLAEEGHDYGPSKRAALYRFVAEKFGLDLKAAQTPEGKIDESRVTVERSAQLRVFDAEFPIPPHALHDVGAVHAAIRKLQQP
jgi:hypothetical protein